MISQDPVDVACRHLLEASIVLTRYGAENRQTLHPDDLTELAHILETIVDQVQPKLMDLRRRMRDRDE